MILIVTHPQDRSAQRVVERLHARRIEVLRFNPVDSPAPAGLSLGIAAQGDGSAQLRRGQSQVDLRQLAAVWFRRPDAPRPHEQVDDPAVRRYLADECSQHLQDLWNALPCPCVPAAPAVLARAELKLSQLQAASSLGLALPPTLATNEPAEFFAFYRRHGGRVISKLAGPSFHRHFGQALGRYTEVVTPRDLGQAACIRFGPVIFQAYVPKRLELRITVVGEQVFAAEIHSQASARTRDDWRRYDLARTPHRPHALPPEIGQACVRLTRRLGLRYGAIDMVLTPDGRYVFLEINPNGQFLWIEELTGLPISDALADLLAARAAAPTPASQQLPEATPCL